MTRTSPVLSVVVLALFLGALGLSVASCAKTRHLAVGADVVISQAVWALDDAELAAWQAHVVSDQQHALMNPKIRHALEDVHAISAAIKASPKTGTIPATLPDLMQDLSDTLSVLQPLEGTEIDALVRKAQAALNAAIAFLRSFN